MSAAFFGALALATTLQVPVERYVLPNGLVVVFHEDHRVPSVVVDLLFRVGSKDERRGRTGFAHLFEHLMFMGTKNVPNGEFDTILEGGGRLRQRVDERGLHQLLRHRPVEPARDLLVAGGGSAVVAAR